MEEKLGDFQNLYPDVHPNWSKLELTGGKPITWDKYLELEKEMIARLQQKGTPLDQRFKLASRYLIEQARAMSPTGSGSDSKSEPGSTSEDNSGTGSGSSSDSTASGGSSTAIAQKLKPMDNHLLLAMHSTYFPTRILRPSENEFQVNRFLTQIAVRGLGTPLKITVPGNSYALDELRNIEWVKDEPEVEDLLYRYFFSRIFGKLYFGAGFGQLTVITGFHHLALVYALVKLQCKALAKSRGAGRVNYLDAIAAIRQLEKRLGEATLSGYAAAMFELLMFSPNRIERVLSAVS